MCSNPAQAAMKTAMAKGLEGGLISTRALIMTLSICARNCGANFVWHCRTSDERCQWTVRARQAGMAQNEKGDSFSPRHAPSSHSSTIQAQTWQPTSLCAPSRTIWQTVLWRTVRTSSFWAPNMARGKREARSLPACCSIIASVNIRVVVSF